MELHRDIRVAAMQRKRRRPSSNMPSRRDDTIEAHTLPEHNASTWILLKCGFTLSEIQHPTDGPVWRWELEVRSPSALSSGWRGQGRFGRRALEQIEQVALGR